MQMTKKSGAKETVCVSFDLLPQNTRLPVLSADQWLKLNCCLLIIL